MLEGDSKLKAMVQSSIRQENNVDEDRCLLVCDILPSGRNFVTFPTSLLRLLCGYR
jgi:hypothetical protein